MNLQIPISQSQTEALGIYFDSDLNGHTLLYNSPDFASVDTLSAYGAGDETAG